MNKCRQCGKKKARRLFCSYSCYTRYAIRHGMWGTDKTRRDAVLAGAKQMERGLAARRALRHD